MPLIEATKANELMVTSMLFDHTARKHSYELWPRRLCSLGTAEERYGFSNSAP